MSADSQDESSIPNSSNAESPAGSDSQAGERPQAGEKRAETSTPSSGTSHSPPPTRENSVVKGHIVNLAAIEAAARRNQTQNVRDGSPFKPNTHQFRNQPLPGSESESVDGTGSDRAVSEVIPATAPASPVKDDVAGDPWDERPPVEAKLLGPTKPVTTRTGVTAETARSGVVATGLILPFALLGAVWFPAGAIMVAGLGVLLGMLGLSSPLQRTAASLLLAHMLTFAWAYYRLL